MWQPVTCACGPEGRGGDQVIGELPQDEPSAVVVGAASVDIRAQASLDFTRGSSVPGSIRLTPGGVGRNIAEALARLGVPTTLLTALGDDSWGQDVLQLTAAAGVDVSRILFCPGERTAGFLVMLDHEGNRALALDNMDLMRSLSADYIAQQADLIRAAGMVVVDGNLRADTLQTVLELTADAGVPVAVDPTSTILAEKLRPLLHHFYLVTPDISEAEVLTGVTISSQSDAMRAAQALISAGPRVAIVTMAEEGSVYATSETIGRVPAMRREVIDRIGLGDVMAATVVFGLLQDLPVDEAVRLGSAAAAYTSQCSEAVCPQLSLELLYDAIAE